MSRTPQSRDPDRAIQAPPRVVRTYRSLLRIYPAWARDAYGEEILRVFVDSWCAGAPAGRARRLAFWARTVLDVAGNGIWLRLTPGARRIKSIREGAGRPGPADGPGPAASLEQRKGHAVETFLQDLRYAVRTLGRAPSFTALVILTLALGIGANTAIFSVVEGVLLRPFPFPDPDRLVLLWQADRLRGTSQELFSAPDFFDLKERQRSFRDVAAAARQTFTLTGPESSAQGVTGFAVTHNYFELLGQPALAGRDIAPDEDVPGVAPVVVLSHELWQSRWGGDLGLIGRSITLDGVPYTVIGIRPPRVEPLAGGELWIPLQTSPYVPSITRRGNHSLFVVGRLAEGITVGRAGEEVQRIMAELEEEYPAENLGRGGWAQPLKDATVGDVRASVLILMGAVGFVLVIACANVANLILSRGVSRDREVAIRSALGAGRLRVMRQFLTESVALALAGGAAGVGLGYAGVKLLLWLAGSSIPRAGNIGINPVVLGFTLVIAVLTGIAFGLVPAVRAARVDLNTRLRDGGSGSGMGRGSARFRSVLVVVEMAVSLTLLIGSGLLIRSFLRLQSVDPGFDPENVLVFSLQLPPARYPQASHPDWPEVLQFYRDLEGRLETLPGVSSVALALNHPLNPGWTTRFTVDGRAAPDSGEMDEARIRAVGRDYIETVGVRLLAGRGFTAADREGAAPVVLINEAMVRKYFQGGDPLGRRISFWGRSREIVGVVRDVRFRGLDRSVPHAMYPPIYQTPFAGFSVLLRAGDKPERLMSLVQREVEALDRDLVVSNLTTMDDLLARSVSPQRFNMVLLGVFAGLALVLSVVGAYGILSYGVAQRTREIGLRMSLGADAGKVLSLVLRQGMALAATGIVLGLLGSVLLSRMMESLLFGVGTRDALTFAAAPILLASAAALASMIPARRASRLNPAAALRAADR